MADQKSLFQSLVNRGYAPHVAAGIVGNMAQESSFNEGAVGDNGNAYGLMQWNGPRKEQLFRYAKTNKPSAEQQLDFMDYEMESGGLRGLLEKTKNPTEAAKLVSDRFERPNPKYANNDRRQSIAESVFNTLIPSAQADEMPDNGAIMDKLKRGIVAAHQAGNTQHAQILAEEYKRLMGAPSQNQAQPEVPLQQIQQQQTPADPTEGMSGGEKFLAGLGGSMVRTGRGIKSLFQHAAGDTEGEAKTIQEAKDAEELDKPLTGSLFSVGGAGKAVGDVLPYLAGGIPAGMAVAAATTPGDMGERFKSAGLAGIGGVVGKGVGKAIGGFAASDAAKKLMSMGIQPTVGQGIETQAKGGVGSTLANILGKSIKQGEEASTSLPLIGAITSNARNRAANEFTQKALGRAEVPGISVGGKTGTQAIEALQDGYSREYTKALSGVEVPRTDELIADISNAVGKKNRFANKSSRDEVMDFIKAQLDTEENQAMGSISANQLKQVASSLKEEARNLAGANNKIERAQSQLLSDAANAVEGYLKRNLPEDVFGRVKELDRGFRNLQVLQNAAGNTSAKEGNFSAYLLDKASRMSDRTRGKKYYASGRSTMRDLSEPANAVLPSSLGESGTTPRAIIAKLIGGGAEGAGALADPVTYATLTSLLGLGSTRAAQKFMLGGYGWQPQASKVAEPILAKLLASQNVKNR